VSVGAEGLLLLPLHATPGLATFFPHAGANTLFELISI
jgi:hypothetical protein